jgi:orotate phosphoribosyltransferase
LRLHSAASAAATKVINAATAAHSAGLKFRVICGRAYLGIALGVAD